MERWKDIAGYEGLYEVSDGGMVRTIKRQGTNARVLRQNTSGKGYKMVTLCKNGKYKGYSVHRLVANAFIENKDNLPCVNHKDENKENNDASNLEWCTYRYNNAYGTARKRASMTRQRKCMARWKNGSVKVFDSCTIAAKATGISQGNIWGACNGMWKRAGGAEWSYV